MAEYTPKQICFFLHKVLKNQKQEQSSKKHISDSKLSWIKNTAMAMLATLEKETLKYNKENPQNVIMANELIASVQTLLNMLLKSAAQELKKE